jgi:hypothetical protein
MLNRTMILLPQILAYFLLPTLQKRFPWAVKFLVAFLGCCVVGYAIGVAHEDGSE